MTTTRAVRAEVSVIVPVYNRDRCVGPALESVLSQDHVDLEVIVVDDGSTDGSAQVVQRFAERDARVRLIRQANSGRPAVPRNVGIRASRGEYVAFLDSDDLWLPGKLSSQVHLLRSRSDVGMVYSWAAYFDGVRALGHCGPKRGSMPEHIFEALLLEQCFPLLSTIVVRRSVLDDVGLFKEDPAYRVAEDYDLWLRIAHDHRAIFIPRVTTLYRVHDGNISDDKPETAQRWRHVIEDTCARYAVDPALRARALASVYLEEFKAGLLARDGAAAASHRLAQVLEHDPCSRTARVASRLVGAGLLPLLQLAYRNRRVLTRVRDAFNRAGALASRAAGGPDSP